MLRPNQSRCILPDKVEGDYVLQLMLIRHLKAANIINSIKQANLLDTKTSDLYRIKLEVFIPASQVAQVVIGQMVTVHLESFPEPYQGTIKYIASRAENVSKTFTAEIEIANPELKIRAGIFANADIHTGEPRNSILVMPQCLQEDIVSTYIYTITQPDAQGMSTAIRKNVKVGRLNQGKIEVIEGLAANEWIVVEGQHYITKDSIVRVTQ